MNQVKFKDWNCIVTKERYAAEQNALSLTDAEDGSPVATASVCLPEHPQDEDEVYIKSWSENEGMADVLVAAGIIAEAHNVLPTGHVQATVHKLLV